MSVQIGKRNYSLIGEETQHAVERGLASAEWYASPIPRKRMKELMQRRDGPAIWHTLLWFALLIGTGAIGYYTWGTWWCVPAFIAYGTLYGSVSDSRWHECGHGTAFKTPWMNDVVYNIASFMVLRQPTTWRWSHTRHHTDTIIVGRDPQNRRSPPSRPRGNGRWRLQPKGRAARNPQADRSHFWEAGSGGGDVYP